MSSDTVRRIGLKRQHPRRAVLALVCAILLIAACGWYGLAAFRANQGAALARGGVQSLEHGDLMGAETAFSAALRQSAADPIATGGLIRLYASQARFDDAAAVVRRNPRAAVRIPHALCTLAEAESRSGSVDLLRSSAGHAGAAAAEEPDCPRAHQVAARTLIALGDSARGLPYLRRAAELEPRNLPIRQELIQQLLGGQRLPEAAIAAEEIVRNFPDRSEGYALLGTCRLLFPPGSPEVHGALNLLNRALKLDANNVIALSQLGHAHLTDGRPVLAIRYLEKARKIAPSRVAVLFDLSRAYRMMGRSGAADEAMGVFRRISDLSTDLASVGRRRLIEPDNQELARRQTDLQARQRDLLRGLHGASQGSDER